MDETVLSIWSAVLHDSMNVAVQQESLVPADFVLFPTQLIVGAWVSFTVTVKLQLPIIAPLELSFSSNVLVVTPTGNAEPEGKPAV